MKNIKQLWLDQIGQPTEYHFKHSFTLLKNFDEPDFDGELYLQANGPGTTQRVLILFPKNLTKSVPGVLVPFYFPEAMLGYNPDCDEDLSGYSGVAIMLHLVRRGYAVASADAYHLTYLNSDRDRSDFYRWRDAAQALLCAHPSWTGMRPSPCIFWPASMTMKTAGK